jgi:16S rRNA (uracil1498-N3)-methyltransferase
VHRFFLPIDSIGAEQVHFPPDVAHQMARVLRLRCGNTVTVLDNRGQEYLVELSNIEANEASGRIVERCTNQTEPATRVSLYVGSTQREKFEWVLQKGTEVGISAFTPVITSRSLVQDRQGLQTGGARRQRWERILQEAAEQSGRGRVPELNPPLQLDEALAAGRRENDVALAAWEGERTIDIRQALARCKAQGAVQMGGLRVALLVGPEGGFAPKEIDLASSSGWTPVTLGRLIMRMETAAIVAAALVLYESGEMTFQNQENPGTHDVI